MAEHHLRSFRFSIAWPRIFPNDRYRIRYMRSHIMMLQRALERGIPLTGYYVWAIEDTYEHGFGQDYDYGLIAINYDTFERTARDSFKWYGEFIKANS